MPRTARIKFENAIYHIMMRGISDIRLFRSNADKEKFLDLLKKYKDSFLFKLYAYCVMDTHVHLLINSNGADVSKFMHNINQCYAQYYNNKYNRKGHVFGDRFKSNIALNDISIMCMSAYIHNNPKDIRGYRNCVENYKYSSFSTYIGRNYSDELLDTSFILNYFHRDPILSRKRYYEFVKSRIDSKFSNFNDEIDILERFKLQSINDNSMLNTNTNININRTINPEKIIEYVANYIHIDKSKISIKRNRVSTEFRALCAFFMRCFSSYDNKQISSELFTSLSSVSHLCNKGYILIKNNINYSKIISDFIEYQASLSF